MSVDLGKARTGIAVCDKNEMLAFPKEVIFEKNGQRLVEKICKSAKDLSAELIVVGLPKNMDGSQGFRCEECRNTAKQIAERSGIPVDLWDERCTTIIATNQMNDTNTRGKKRKQLIDSAAAAVILQDYLSYRKNK
jgi:putative Holliday junction resolvase